MSELGRIYEDGEIIIRQGDAGQCMYEILDGKVEVLQERKGKEISLAILKKGNFFGEMAIFEREIRSATIRALGKARILTVDKRILLRRVSEDPSLALRILEKMSNRIREMDEELVNLKQL